MTAQNKILMKKRVSIFIYTSYVFCREFLEPNGKLRNLELSKLPKTHKITRPR